ncbi:MAG: hypothetical protein M1838_004269, partial [Thelocarpon superellum]
CHLWKYFLEDDVEHFRRLLAEASYVSGPPASRGITGGGGYLGPLASSLGSPGPVFSPSPRTLPKSRRTAGWSPTMSAAKVESPWAALNLTRADVNLRDRNGLTILMHAASSTSKTALGFARALLEHPLTDLYVQDLESGWTALHRALYFGNVTIARAIMDRDLQDARGKLQIGAGLPINAGRIIKVKDREGNSPFDVLNATVATRKVAAQPLTNSHSLDMSEGSDFADHAERVEDRDLQAKLVAARLILDGDEVFTFGSNKNLNLGLGNEDDRQFPERVSLKRPDHLLHRFHYEQLQEQHHGLDEVDPTDPDLTRRATSSLPFLTRHRPIVIQNVVMSKLHTVVYTADPEANLYACGFGPGGRLGTGDEITRFHFVCIEGGGLAGKQVVSVALGQNHTLAITREAEVFSWGTNTCGQLGYALPKPAVHDEEPVQTSPRQIFGPLKRERIRGAVASRVHSAVFTATSLFTFGKNEGQLGLVDSDARSLQQQTTPRKVAAALFSSPIAMVSAIDRATVCLLENHEVWVFANFGYAKMAFPLESFSNYFLKSTFVSHDPRPNHVAKVASGGDTICVMTHEGDVYTVKVSQRLEPGVSPTSTTNPIKIRNALSPPQRIWSLRKGHLAVRDVDVGQDGSVIICTDAGSVWRRVKRATIQDTSAIGTAEYKPKDYKFSRVPGLTRILAVRSNAFGAFAAVRKDCDVTKTQIATDSPTLWDDLSPLLPFHDLEVGADEEEEEEEDDTPRFWTPSLPKDHFNPLKAAVLTSADLESDMRRLLAHRSLAGEMSTDAVVATSASEVQIPVHRFIVSGRSAVLRKLLRDGRKSGQASVPDLLTIETNEQGRPVLRFHALDFLSILNFVSYCYQDSVVDVWQYTRHAPKYAFRYRQVRAELLKIALRLELRELEAAVRIMREPNLTLHHDLAVATADPSFFDDGDTIVELAGAEVKVHSALMRQRCPFFEGLFYGRAAGQWLSARRELMGGPSEATRVDLKHVEPSIFRYVVRYLYADVGEGFLDDVVCEDLDEFLDLVTEVLSVANELMLDRLSQMCQKILGRFVTTRNVCQLLNAVAPCAVTTFKEACLEYICLNLEGLLENHLLDELDEDLLLELDVVVRENQRDCLPFVRSGKADALLQEKFPELADARNRERQSKIDSVLVRARMGEPDFRMSGSYKTKLRPSSVSEVSSTQHRTRRKSSREVGGGSAGASPLLTSKASTMDLMFDMDDDEAERVVQTPGMESGHEPSTPGTVKGIDWAQGESPQLDSRGSIPSGGLRPLSLGSACGPISPTSPPARTPGPPNAGQPWGSSPLPSAKLSMKDIISQASSSRTSNLSASLSHQAKVPDKNSPSSTTGGKLSQRERKKQQQQQQQQSTHTKTTPPLTTGSGRNGRAKEEERPSPWQAQTTRPIVSLKEVLSSEARSSSTNPASSPLIRTSSIPPISLTKPTPTRNTSSPLPSQASTSSPPRQSTSHPNPPRTPRNVSSSSSAAPGPEPALQLSMAEIISQQETEQEVLKQTVAKRSLQEIQQEQAFMEWWDAETRKARDEGSGEGAKEGLKEGRVAVGEVGQQEEEGDVEGGGIQAEKGEVQ